MGKNRHSAVRKIDPVTDQQIPEEIAQLVGSDATVEVAQSDGTVVAEQPKQTDMNPVAKAGHNLVKLIEAHKNKSGVIRFLASENFKIGDIAKFMNIRYQHVRNVLHTPAKKPQAAPVSKTE